MQYTIIDNETGEILFEGDAVAVLDWYLTVPYIFIEREGQKVYVVRDNGDLLARM